jgi:hypothetical protein
MQGIFLSRACSSSMSFEILRNAAASSGFMISGMTPSSMMHFDSPSGTCNIPSRLSACPGQSTGKPIANDHSRIQGSL